MNNETITMSETTTVTEPEQSKRKWFGKGGKVAKKAIMFATIVSCMAMTGGIHAFAGNGVVDTSSFITTSCTVLKSVISLIDGGVSLWGIVNLLEGYGNDNAGAKLP